MSPEQFGQVTSVEPSLMVLALYGVLVLIGVIFIAVLLAMLSLPLFFGAMGLMELSLRGFQNSPDPIGKYSKLAGLVFRSLRRNLLRTALTYTALFVLTFMLTMIYATLTTIQSLMTEKEGAQLALMTEKFGIPSTLKPGYVSQLKSIMNEKMSAANRPDDVNKNVMTWSFIGGTLNLEKRTPENALVMFALDPDAIANEMMAEQGLSREELGDKVWQDVLQAVELVKLDKRNIVVGEERLKVLGKKVGDEIVFYPFNYVDIQFECKIVGALPSGTRVDQAGAIRFDYLVAKLNQYENDKKKPHPVADRCVNLIWVRLKSKAAFQELAAIVNNPSEFASPAVKMETFSAAIGSFLEPLKDILWGLKYIIMPAIVVIMCLVIGITITIGVRERWSEMAVMKVLGFQPWQIMTMIVSEATLIGVFGGMLSTWAVYFAGKIGRAITHALNTRVSFIENFKAPEEVLIYGPALGILVGVVGALLPAWNARKVKVSEVFAKIA
jgi:putative ABC transport system permease protein